MATPYRSTVTIDGTKFDALSTNVALSTLKDRAGMPVMGSLTTAITCHIDMHDDTNLPYSALSNIFNLANVVTKAKVKPIKIEYWKDDSKQDALCSISFQGWISKFETANPMPTSAVQSSNTDTSPYSTVNHLLTLQIEPALNQANVQEITMSN
jgi:hypothetical protein